MTKQKTAPAGKTTSPAETLDRLIRARYPVIVIESYEEARVLDAVKFIAEQKRPNQQPKAVLDWSYAQGLRHIGGAKVYNTPNRDETKDPVGALRVIFEWSEQDTPTPALFVFKDLHQFCGNGQQPAQADVVRWIREIAIAFQEQPTTLIIVSPHFAVPSDLEKDVAVMEWPLPSQAELTAILDECGEQVSSQGVKVALKNGSRERVIQALQGLTAIEAANVLAMAVVTNGALDEKAVSIILAEKKQIVKKTGYLEFWDADVSMNDIGGLAALKEYAAMKRASFSSEASAYGLPAPRGFLLVGPPGAGKSLTAKASTGGQMPLLRLDVAALMGSLVGQSEQNARSALRVAEAIAPCVLWIDEIEKGFAGMQGGELDGGTSRRMLGTILTWMQEHTSPVYVIATCNDVTSLPPELLSRFDDLWYVDMPNRAERAEIITIHLAKRGRNPADFDLPILAEATEGYVGREIEKIVVLALNRGFGDGARQIKTEDMLWATKRIVPLSKTTPEKLNALHKWAEGRARNASGEDDAEETTTKRARKLEL